MSNLSFTSRDDFKCIAKAKLKDAIILLQNNRCSSAYYLSGYAVEMGLKSVVCKAFFAECLPNKNFVSDVHTHDLEKLLKLSGLKPVFDEECKSNPNLAANWAIVSQWKETSRYEIIDEANAIEMANAISDPTHGVMQWLTTHW